MASFALNQNENYSLKDSNFSSNRKSIRSNLKKKAGNISHKSKDDFSFISYADENSKTEPKSKNEKKKNNPDIKVIKINFVSRKNQTDMCSKNPFDSFNSNYDKENQQPNIPSIKTTQDYYREINKDSIESIIPSKPMINSASSKAFMLEYSKSKKYQEDKNNLIFPSTTDQTPDDSEEYPIQDKIILTSVDTHSTIMEDNNEKDDSFSLCDRDTENLLHYQESHLPVPLDKKDDENYKILTMKKMKRKTMPPNKSVRKFAEDKEPVYEKEFRIQNDFCKLLKKKVVHSTRRIYSSKFVLRKGNKDYDFMIFRDKDIGVYEYWQAHIHEAQNDEDIDTDEEQKQMAKCFTIGELKEAFLYVRDKSFQDCFINFNRFKKFRNTKENEYIVNRVEILQKEIKL